MRRGGAFEVSRPQRAGEIQMPAKLVWKEQIMKRVHRSSTFTGIIVAAVCLVSCAPTLNAGPYGYFYGGGYGLGYGGYSAYGQGPYAYGSPAGYSTYPVYGGYGYQGFGAGPYGYGSIRSYFGVPSYRAYSAPYNSAVYSPYSAPIYSPYGFGVQSYYGY